MAYAKRLIASACTLAMGFALSGCGNSADDDPAFPAASTPAFVALYGPASTGHLPFPSDFPAYLGTQDGTLNFTGSVLATVPLGSSLNALDGFSTTAQITTTFSDPINPATLSGSTIVVIEMYLSNTNKGPATSPSDLPVGVTSPVRRVLTYGTDYVADVSPAVDSGGTILRIRPLKPLAASSGAINSGYIVLLTDGIRDFGLRQAQPSSDYATIKNAPADCSGISNATLSAFCPWFKGHLKMAQAVGVNPANVVLSWSFSTQSVDDTFVALDKLVTAQPIVAQATPATSPLGKANIYVGTTRVPYYSALPTNKNDATFLNSFWVAAGPPAGWPDQTSRSITRFNPVPLKRADVTIPVLYTVPNAKANTAGGGCPKPTAGWPVVIVQHGLQRSRKDALAMADAFAEACFILAAIDLPMHGITDTADPLYQAANERTFNVDLINNTTGASGPDGKIDDSGAHLAGTLLGNPLAGKDIFLKQGEADLGVVAKSLRSLDVTGDGQSDIDAARVHYVGLSLGGIVGVAQSKYGSGFRTATVAAPGGPFTQIALESPAFIPLVKQKTASLFPYESNTFFMFFRDVQTLIDSGDPINHICNCASAKPLHLMKVIADTVIPNSTTDNLIRAANLTKVSSGIVPVAPGKPVYTAFTFGSHGSLFDPTASPAATQEMQLQAVKFAVSAVQPGGPFLVVTNPAVVQQ